MDCPRWRWRAASTICNNGRGRCEPRRAGAGGRAVASALPAARAAQEAAAERVRLAAGERDAALHAVTVEAATFAAGELTEALNRALAVEAKILSLREALSAQTNVLAAAEKISAALETSEGSGR